MLLVKLSSGGSLRGELREVVPDHVQAAGSQGGCEEVLQAAVKGLQWTRAGAVQDRLRNLMHNKIHSQRKW